MKALVIATALFSMQAFAYNTTYNKVQFGKLTVVETNTKAMKDAKVVSLMVDVNSTSGKYPIVQVANPKSCAHKQTLIMFSGFDLATRAYKRTYEVQIERDPSQPCYLDVYASTSAQDKMMAARVSIVPGK